MTFNILEKRKKQNLDAFLFYISYWLHCDTPSLMNVTDHYVVDVQYILSSSLED